MSEDRRYDEKIWLKHYSKGVVGTIEYEKLPMIDALYRSAKDHPNNTALIFEGYKVTYARLVEMVERLATALADMGVEKGDRVALLLPNTIHCVAAYYAIHRANAIVVSNNPLYSDREIKYQLNDSGSKVLITIDLPANRTIDLRPKTKVKQIITCSIGDYLPFPKNILFPLVAKKKGLKAEIKKVAEVYTFKEIIAKYPPNPPEKEIEWEDAACLQYTGGTTGESKGVMLTHKNLSCNVQQIEAWYPEFKATASEDTHMGALPIFHSFGMTCAMNYPIWAGSAIALIPRPEPKPLLDAVTDYKVSFLALVPTMYVGMLNHPDLHKYDLGSIKGCFSGSAPLPIEVIERFEKLTGAAICEGFGLTESAPVTHMNPFGQGAKRIPGSVGLPAPDTLCRVVDQEDGAKELPVGEPGELIIKGPQIMKGYWNKPEETEIALRDGWLYTGDIATMDEEGYFYIVDRKKDMIIASGFNVYPREIDEVLYKHPKIKEACTIGVPHEYRGETVKIFIVLKEGETATSEEIIEYCRENMAKYKVPKIVEFRDDLPKSAIGKVLRKELRKKEIEKMAGKKK
ncbi:MAG: long-chain fatty acid--CoA ligase [Thermodesulfobacteriota bacterium]|nr:long-chain fatty acid--CoA ligase [Thermodesulfobacteriota bacterium]